MRCPIHHDIEYDRFMGKCWACEARERDEAAQEREKQLEQDRRRREDEAEHRQRILAEQADQRSLEDEVRQVERAIAAREREEQRETPYERKANHNQHANHRRAAVSKISEAYGLFNARVYDQALVSANEAAGLGESDIEMNASMLITQIYIATGNTAEYLKIAESWTTFPFEIIDYLLRKKKIDIADELFKRKVNARLDFSADFHWTVCPIGIELAEQGKQDHRWIKTFEEKLKEAEFGYFFKKGFSRAMQSDGLSNATKKKLRDLVITAFRKQIKIKSARLSKERVDELIKWGLVYDGIRGPKLFASVWAISVIALFWKATAVGAFIAGAAVFLLASIVRSRSNSRHMAAEELSTRLQAETSEFASILSVGESDVKSLFGDISPNYFSQTVRDVLVVAAVILTMSLLFFIVF